MEKESKTRVDGSFRSQEAIRLIIKKHRRTEAMLTLPANKAKWDELYEGVSNKQKPV